MDEQKYDIVVRHYRRILDFISRYLIILSAIAIAIFLFKSVFLNPTYIADYQDPFVLKKIQLIGNFNNLLEQAQQGANLHAYIIQGALKTEDKTIVSQDNLLTYKDIIVPRLFTIDTSLPVKPLSYFENANYNTGELEFLISNFLLNEQVVEPSNATNAQLPVDTSLSKAFNLSCVFTNKLSQSTCDYYIQKFLDSFFVFNLKLDYKELSSIFDNLQGNKQHVELFCKDLQKYLLYTNDASKEIKLLFDQCGDDAKNFFKKMENFIDIQNQLEQGFINADTYKDPYLNYYKLLSYQQILYRDMEANRVIYNQYIMYLNFVKELLKPPVKLDHFYYDEMYRFDVYYLKPALQGTRYESRIGGIKDDQIATIIKTIDSVNGGDLFGEYPGLISQVFNKKILVIGTSSGTKDNASLTDTMTKKLKYLSYLQVDKFSIKNNQAEVSGYFVLGNTNIATSVELTYQDDTFYVHQITLPEYPRLLSALKIMFVNKKISIGDVYSAITKNFAFYQTNDVIATGQSALCADIRTWGNAAGVNIQSCSPDSIIFDKVIHSLSGTNDVTYTFFLNNFIPTSITVSNDTLQKNVGILITLNNSDSLTGLLQKVIDVPFVLPVAQDTGQHEGNSTTISVLETFQKYLSIKPNDIAEKSGKVLIDFTLSSIYFLAYYNVNTHILSPMYFKSVGTAGVPLIIQGLSLTLDDDHLDSIKQFIANPLTVIQGVDVNAWRNYVSPNASSKAQ